MKIVGGSLNFPIKKFRQLFFVFLSGLFSCLHSSNNLLLSLYKQKNQLQNKFSTPVRAKLKISPYLEKKFHFCLYIQILSFSLYPNKSWFALCWTPHVILRELINFFRPACSKITILIYFFYEHLHWKP